MSATWQRPQTHPLNLFLQVTSDKSDGSESCAAGTLSGGAAEIAHLIGACYMRMKNEDLDSAPQYVESQARQHVPTVPALRRQRQEGT